MKVNFDDARRKLVREFNELAISNLSPNQCEIMKRMRLTVGAFLCMEDSREQPQDCNSLIDVVKLEDI